MYYPLSQISTNLYTNGNEYVLITNNQNYVGYYWKSSQGKFFTGKTPQDAPTIQLVLTNPSINSNRTTNAVGFESNNLKNVEYLVTNNNIISYNKIKKVDTSKTINLPTSFTPLPSSKDYKIGEFRRYFCKKVNELTYIEISKETYDKLVNKDSQILYELYFPFNVPWQITGESEKQVYIINRNIVELTSKKLKLYKFKEYLRNDFAKYYK